MCYLTLVYLSRTEYPITVIQWKCSEQLMQSIVARFFQQVVLLSVTLLGAMDTAALVLKQNMNTCRHDPLP